MGYFSDSPKMVILAMKKCLFLLFACISIVAHADDITFEVKAPSSAVTIGKKFYVVYYSNGKACHSFKFDGINNTLPNDLGGLHVTASPTYPNLRSFVVDEAHPKIMYRWELVAEKEGTFTIPAATLVIDGKKMTSDIVKVTAKAMSSENVGTTSAKSAKPAQTALQSADKEADSNEGPVSLSKWKGMKLVRLSSKSIDYRLKEIPVSPSKKQIVINNYETNHQFRDGMLAVCNEDLGKWGFYDEEGNQLPGGFKWSKPFSMGSEFAFGSGHCIVFEHVRSESGFHNFICYIIDKQGRTRRLPAGDNATGIWPFNNGGIAAVATKGSGIYVSFFNTRGEQVLKGIHAEESTDSPIGDFIDGWARLYAGYGGQHKGYTFVDKNERTIGKYFRAAQEFSEGLAAVKAETSNGDRWGFIDTKGDMVIEPRFSNQPTPFSCGFSVVKKQNGNMVYIDKKGNVCGQEVKWLTSFVGGKAFAASENYSDVWILDTEMKRHEIPSKNDGIYVRTEDIRYLAEYPPVRTVLEGQYIVSHQGPYSGPKEHTLIDPHTGKEHTMVGFGNESVFDHISPHRIHVSWRDGNTRHDGFINESGEFCLEFVKDEF